MKLTPLRVDCVTVNLISCRPVFSNWGIGQIPTVAVLGS